jgi:hypothetical protein
LLTFPAYYAGIGGLALNQVVVGSIPTWGAQPCDTAYLGGVMPKETQSDGGFELIVGWDNHHTVQVGVDSGQEFEFLVDDTTDGPYTGLWFTFYNEEQINQFIKTLHKAKRRTFK